MCEDLFAVTGKDEDDVKIISSEDEKIKLLGEIFSNDSSRKILRRISNGTEMTANEIAQKTDMSLALVIHHLKRMQTVGMVKVTKTEKSTKGQDMKYYLATKQSFLIVPTEKTAHPLLNSFKRFSKFVAIGMAGLVSWAIVKPDDANYNMMPIHQTGHDDFTSGKRTAAEEVTEWSSASQTDTDANLIVSSEPTPEPEPAPSHSGVVEFDYAESGEIAANTGSVSLDRTVYPVPFDGTGAESIEPFVLSIIIPIAVIGIGIILERVLTRWLKKRKGK